MYDFLSESRKLEKILKASNACADPNDKTPRLFNLVHTFIDAVEAPGSGVDTYATRQSRISEAAVAILRTDLAFHAVKRIQLCNWARFQPVSDDYTASTPKGVVVPSDCVEANHILRILTTIATVVEDTRIPLLKQVRLCTLLSPATHVITMFKCMCAIHQI